MCGKCLWQPVLPKIVSLFYKLSYHHFSTLVRAQFLFFFFTKKKRHACVMGTSRVVQVQLAHHRIGCTALGLE
jgi:hypothetical protein